MAFLYLCLVAVILFMLMEPFLGELTKEEAAAFRLQEKAMQEADLEFKKRMVKQALKEADLDFHAQKMAESDYQEIQNEIYKQALDEMKRKPKT